MTLKRCFDVIMVVVSLPIIMPVMILVAFLIRRRLGTPVFFKQKRPGRFEKPFVMFKFRTMKELVDDKGCLLSDEKRMTPFGRFLRSTSIDELPELMNVLAGDMSLVGPRPLLMDYLSLYNDTQRRRHEVLPGITGWAQINGRNAISWQQKFELDVWYVDNQSLWLDMKILFYTIWKVVKRTDISQLGHVSMDKFEGN